MRRSRRVRLRLIRHYLPLLTLTGLGTVALTMWVNSPLLAYQLSLATAFAGLVLFGVSLAIGPLGLLWRGRLLPVSTDLRRDVGILAAVLSLGHAVVGLLVYPDIRLYFLYPVAEWQQAGFALRLDDFGAANWMGLGAAIVLGLLLATSGDWALRRYGARRWKSLQQLAYWAFALVVVHAVLYQRLDPHDQRPLVIVLGVIVGGVIVLQTAGFLRAERRLARRAAR
jgi:methionine sulfoxide reductase heme-binding subunit